MYVYVIAAAQTVAMSIHIMLHFPCAIRCVRESAFRIADVQMWGSVTYLWYTHAARSAGTHMYVRKRAAKCYRLAACSRRPSAKLIAATTLSLSLALSFSRPHVRQPYKAHTVCEQCAHCVRPTGARIYIYVTIVCLSLSLTLCIYGLRKRGGY